MPSIMRCLLSSLIDNIDGVEYIRKNALIHTRQPLTFSWIPSLYYQSYNPVTPVTYFELRVRRNGKWFVTWPMSSSFGLLYFISRMISLEFDDLHKNSF